MTKNTVLLEEHKALGAKLIPFAGWMMPLQYRGIVQEHYAVRKYAGLFDVSHMGEFWVKGKDAVAFLNHLVPQDISKMATNKVLYCQLTNEQAGIIDDLLVYKISDEEFLLVVNASRISIDFDWIKRNSKKYDVQVENKSQEYSLIALQGPNASLIMTKLGLVQSMQPEFMHFGTATISGADVLISRTGYTGEDGFEILVENSQAKIVWQAILSEGEEFKVEPIGLGARDTLRLEAALLLHGHEMNEKTTPIEAGLKWSVCLDKEADYIGKNVILQQAKYGVKKKLVGFNLIERGIARSGDKIFENEKLIGMVTSGTMSPISKIPFGLAYVNNTDLKIGDTFQIEIRGKLHLAKIVKRPFVKKVYAK
ncbi:MAG: glycine cleavage system aminomethyltransferase GcvT [Candidatus Gastranaerophilales bacterium]|nr:glycine cleavage system aminomethyltransferase GcvT [Candidatus Gastranaerophilales bacterium]